MPILNPPNEGGVVTSKALNLTRITTLVAAALGVVATGSGVGANIAGTDDDWVGFNDAQRLVIVVALIAAVAIVHAADLFARSLATSRAVGSGVIPLASPPKADLKHEGVPKVSGKVLAIRGGDSALLFFDPDNDKTEWVPESAITFK